MVCAEAIDIGFDADKIVGFVDRIIEGKIDEFVVEKGDASIAMAFIEFVKPFAVY